jgi:hypothetical protein
MIAVGQVRGVLAERVVVSQPGDPFMALKAAASHSGLRVSTLRRAITDCAPACRLPAYLVAGQYLLRRSELDAWITRHRVTGPDLDRIVTEMTRGLDRRARPGREEA